MESSEKTIQDALQLYLESISLARRPNTSRAYRNAMKLFTRVLEVHNLPVDTNWVKNLPVDAIAWFAVTLKDFSPATERLYLTAAAGFYEFLAAESLADPNLPRMRLLIHQRSRKPGQRLPQFPRETIEIVINYAINIASFISENQNEHLRNLRDRAFLLTLSDTGLRVHEACKLRRGDIDKFERRAMIVGKGDKQAIIRFSTRAMDAINDYLKERAVLDGASGRPLPSLPLFARHDRGAGKKIKPITTRTGQDIVEQRVAEAVGPEAVGTITPHSFRHYFVTTVLRSSGNLKLAQELARHSNIAITQRYAHISDDELDQGYHEIFNKK